MNTNISPRPNTGTLVFSTRKNPAERKVIFTLRDKFYDILANRFHEEADDDNIASLRLDFENAEIDLGKAVISIEGKMVILAYYDTSHEAWGTDYKTTSVLIGGNFKVVYIDADGREIPTDFSEEKLAQWIKEAV